MALGPRSLRLPAGLRHAATLPLRPTVCAAAAAAEAQPSAAPETNGSGAARSSSSSKADPLRLAAEVLWPDRFLVLGTAFTLVCTICLTLAFPLALGDIFDVVRQHLAANPEAAAAAAGAGGRGPAPVTLAGVTELVADIRGVAAAAPAGFYPVLTRLCACLCASAAGNGAVAYLAPLLGERFAARLRKRLMAETLAKDQAFFDGAGKGDVTARLGLDVAVVQATVADFLGQRGIRSILEVFCSLAIM